MSTRPEIEQLEAERRKYLERIQRLMFTDFDPQRWEELRETLYATVSLNADVIIDDCTFREGIQMAGLVTPHPSDTCTMATMLRDVGVERLEVLFYTKTDQEAVKLMRDEGLGPMLAGWCRANTADIDLARKLELEQVGISHPVSYLHFVKWPHLPLNDLIDRVVKAVQYAHDHGLRVFVHGEDSTRAHWDFERLFINEVAAAGAEVYRICDTVGCGISDPSVPPPQGIPMKVKLIKEETRIPYVEIHAHDDLGNAVENTMAFLRTAAKYYDKVYASTTFLGIGDRAGNAETEKIIINCYMIHGIKKWNLAPFRDLALLLASATGFSLPLNKALVGDSAFAHESGIHLQGIKQLPVTYEVVPPELVGQERIIVIGKRSGKHGIKMKLEEILKREIPDDDPRFKQLVEIITRKFREGRRRTPLREDEFRALAHRVGFEVES